MNKTTSDTKLNHSSKQPKVFLLSMLTALFERGGYYVLAFFVVLYTKSEFNYSDTYAYALFGVFTAFTYLTPALGGYIADNILGIRRTMAIGILLEGLGLYAVAVPHQIALFIGASLLIVGVGLFKTGPTNLMGRAYQKNDPRIDAGFTWYYMAINVGSVLTPIVVGVMREYLPWSAAFIYGGTMLVINFIVFMFINYRADGCESKAGKKKASSKTWALTLFGTVISAFLCVVFLKYLNAANIFFVVATSILFAYFAYEIIRSPKIEKLKIIACVALIIIGFAFFVLYFQYYTTVTLFFKRCVSHPTINFFNWWQFTIPTEFYLALNPAWIIVLSPIVVATYNYLGKRGKDLEITTKFCVGLLITSLCFLVFNIGILIAGPKSHYLVGSIWPVLGMGLYSLGELLVSALGVAMVTHIAPKRMYGVMMGAWFLIAAALASSISGKVASIASISDTLRDPALILHIYGNAFFKFAIAGIIASIIAFACAPYIKKIANVSD